jgi:hypothetical protein
MTGPLERHEEELISLSLKRMAHPVVRRTSEVGGRDR